MPLRFLFWLLMLVWLFFGLWPLVTGADANWHGYLPPLLLFALLGMLGWRSFGKPVDDGG